MVVLKATRSEPIVKESILESRESSEAEPSIMKVLDKLCLPASKPDEFLPFKLVLALLAIAF